MHRINMIQTARTIACSLLILGILSCSLVPTSRQREPSHVVIVNNSGADLYNVSAREVPRNDAQPSRLASVSPLLRGNSYAVMRQPDSKPLTPVVRVTWEHRNGNQASTIVSIEEAVKRATGEGSESLVLAIQPSGGVSVFLAPLEQVAP